MRSLIVLAVLLGVVFGAPKRFNIKRLQDTRIVGGEPIEIEEAPWQTALEWYGYQICGASVISEEYIVTAAHCTDGSLAEELTIRAGTSLLESGGVVVQVAEIYQDPDFDYANIDYDISVLKLAESLEFSESIAAIALPAENEQPEDGSVVSVTGWGTTEEGGYSSDQLQRVDVNIVSLADCQAAYSDELVTDRMLCAGVTEGGKDACQGDSGGPLYQNGILYGTVSWGYGCARPDYPGVYGNVGNLRGYIAEVTGL